MARKERVAKLPFSKSVVERMEAIRADTPDSYGVKLYLALTASKISVTALSAAVGVGARQLYGYMYGERVPSTRMRKRIRGVFKAVSWGMKGGDLPKSHALTGASGGRELLSIIEAYLEVQAPAEGTPDVRPAEAHQASVEVSEDSFAEGRVSVPVDEHPEQPGIREPDVPDTRPATSDGEGGDSAVPDPGRIFQHRLPFLTQPAPPHLTTEEARESAREREIDKGVGS